jgi:hypothetical protein
MMVRNTRKGIRRTMGTAPTQKKAALTDCPNAGDIAGSHSEPQTDYEDKELRIVFKRSSNRNGLRIKLRICGWFITPAIVS